MDFLLISIFLSILIALTFKSNFRRKVQIFHLIIINYLVTRLLEVFFSNFFGGFLFDFLFSTAVISAGILFVIIFYLSRQFLSITYYNKHTIQNLAIYMNVTSKALYNYILKLNTLFRHVQINATNQWISYYENYKTKSINPFLGIKNKPKGIVFNGRYI